MMIKQSGGSANPEIERMIRETLQEHSRYERELRSAHRENLVCPVTVVVPNQADPIQGFSRNISATGICILTDSLIPENLRVVLEIYRLNGNATRVQAECRWSKPFGDRYYASGWQFLNVVRPR